MQLTNISTEATYQRDLDTLITQSIVKTNQNLELYNRFKVGEKPSTKQLFDIMFLSEMICNRECYITDKEYSVIKQKIKQYG